MSPMTAAVSQRREMDHPPLGPEHFNLKDWLINSKTPKSFEPFSGKPEGYKNWASRVKDHLMSSNLAWGRLLEVAERDRYPLTRARLASMAGIDQADLDLNKLSQILWSFIGSHALKDTVYERRLQLTGGRTTTGLSFGELSSRSAREEQSRH